MQLTIHRGTREIGGSCVELQSGNTRLIIDVGLPLVDQDREPFDRNALRGKELPELVEEGIVPRVAGLFIPGELPDAILLSHSHLDHVGLLHLTPETIPVYASTGTSKMMNAGAMFSGQQRLPRERHVKLASGTPVAIGNFTVTPYVVDHSCYGSMAFLVEAEGKRLLYSGDLRMHGRKPGMIKSLIADVGPLRVDALIMEGTHFGSIGRQKKTEYELEFELTDLIRSAPGLVLGSFSPIDVDRLVSYLKATMRNDRTFVVDAYAAYVLHLVKSEIGVPDPTDPKAPVRVYFNEAFQRKGITKLQEMFAPNRIDRDEILSRPKEHAMVFRPSMLKLDFDGDLPTGSRCLYSFWQGYLDRPDWTELKRHLAEVNGDFVPAHTSGHIFMDDLINFVQSINPKQVIPIHTFEPEAYEQHFDDVRRLNDGEPIEV